MTDPDWLSTTKVVRLLAIDRHTLYRLIDRGEITAYRIGRVIRLKRADVLAFVDNSRINPGELPANWRRKDAS
jgi:putative molybdopterin biosynthesis protein